MTDVAEIARSLTKAQRQMVMTDDRGFARHAKEHWHGLTNATGRRLYELGLVEQPNSLTKPTVLGLAVRDYLKEQQG